MADGRVHDCSCVWMSPRAYMGVCEGVYVWVSGCVQMRVRV